MKTVTILGCLLILAALGQPTMGHDDEFYSSSGVHRYPPGHVENGVNGKFYGAAAYYVALADGPGVYDPTNGNPIITSLDFFVAQARMNCDREVSGDGSATLMALDETHVDGTSYGSNAMMDGTFDDGGYGGACHTSSADYAFPGYNSPGCVDDGARASNFAPFAAPWVGAACDWKTESGATPCDPLPNTGGTTRCTSSICISPCTNSCGSDGITDGINFGGGHYRVAYPNNGGPDTFTGDGLGCPDSEATMAAFVFTGVTVTYNGLLTRPQVTINPAFQGDIWQVW